MDEIENINNDQEPANSDQKNESGIDKKESAPKQPDYATLQKEIRAELDTNRKYLPFFEKYTSFSAGIFKDSYARRKSSVLLYGTDALTNEEDLEIRYSVMAEEYLWHIQQRKLFDMQCRWRAEEVVIKEIEVTSDFEVWSEEIETCPFLTPISEDEFALYLSFVETGRMDEVIPDFTAEWQKYGDLKLQYTDIDSDDYFYQIPAWYEYYEARTGLGALYLLDDIRGKKEEFYLSLWRNENRRKSEEANQATPKPEPDTRPFLPYNDNAIYIDFIHKFEDTSLINKWKAYYDREDRYDNRELEEALDTLRDALEPWPIADNKDWKQGVIDASREYIRKKLLEELPKAYKNYLFRINSGLGFEAHFRSSSGFKPFSVKEMILGGRELNGEPRDCNF